MIVSFFSPEHNQIIRRNLLSMSQFELNFKRMYTVQVTRGKRETQLAHRWFLKMLAVGRSCAKPSDCWPIPIIQRSRSNVESGQTGKYYFSLIELELAHSCSTF